MTGRDGESRPRVSYLELNGETLAVLSVPMGTTLDLSSLTPSERDVALRASSGESNREIARGRGTSERTVANQLASIFEKLGVGSRAELAARLRRS